MKMCTLLYVLCLVIPNRLPAQFIEIQKAEIIDDRQLRLFFKETLPDEGRLTPAFFQLNNGMGAPISIQTEDSKTALLLFSQAFRRGMPYRIQVKSTDRADKPPFEVIYPDVIDLGDIVINELLPNPKTGSAEFVEIYNRSDKTLDLAQLELTALRPSGDLYTPKKIATVPTPLLPGNYKLLTVDPEAIQAAYPAAHAEAFIRMAALPQLNNEQGTVLLLSGHLIVDQLQYHEDMHHPLITAPKGVSLERKNVDRPTNEPGNFTSASALSGYGTPGYKNSQTPNKNEGDRFFLNSKTFSPDNDGFEDRLEISYQIHSGDKLVNITVYNRDGQLIKKIASNTLLGTEGTIPWDGTLHNGQIAKVGIYLVNIELYDTQGFRKTYRLACVLARKF